MKNLWLVIIFVATLLSKTGAQGFDSRIADESILYATTKQVNQFFRRFNAEESTKGERYNEGDRDYRNPTLRNNYLNILFDEQNASINDAIKSQFIKSLLDVNKPAYINFHANGWFAEVTTKFLYQGVDEYVTLFMHLEQENLGYKWVISSVYFPHFKNMFPEHSGSPKFLHPMSHEIDFMNLIRVFSDKDNVEQYTDKDHNLNYLSLFLYELKKGNLKYKAVTNLKFHFFQIPGWYFEISNFNRPGANSGWLISNLMKVTKQEEEILIKFIKHE